MKRISLWAVSTLSVLVLLFSYNTSTTSQKIAATPTTVISSRTTQQAAAPEAANAPETNAEDPAPDPAPETTITGDVVDTEEGPVQVRATVAGGRLTAVDVVQYPTGNSQHEEINGRALPILIQESLDAQGTDIDMVSGATSTSTGYIGSLQSALDEANL